MAASTGFSHSNSTIWSKFQSVLGRPIVQRCRDIEDLIVNSSSKDLSQILPSLLENIFGFGTEPGWGLDMITKSHQLYEFDSVLRLLGPEGRLMNLVYNLQTDLYLTYEFPFSYLPAPTRHMIEDGSLPMFYVNKLQYQNYSKPVLALNAFELYMFYFSYILVSPQWQNKTNNWNSMTEVVYPCLLDEYLKYFLPLNKKSLPKFPQTHNASARSPMMQQLQQTPVSGRHSPGSVSQTRSRSRLGLLRANLLSSQKPHPQASPGADKAENDIWWTETFIQIIAEFWLNQNSLDNERGISPQNLSSSLSSNHSYYGNTDPFHSIFESFLPSNNQVRLTRLLLKHVHLFVSSVEPEVVNSLYQTVETSPLDEFKGSLLPSILQKKIYGFLRHGFDRWPLDSSFRLLLETWLTYIQPWRYVDSSSKGGKTDTDTDSVHDLWFPFIRDNFLFYTSLFQEFLQRCSRMHLTSVHNAYMVFRVSKVFSLTNLPQLLREVEKMMYSSAYKQAQDLGGSYIAPEISTVLRVQIMELERVDFNYVNMFGRDTVQQIHHLLLEILTAKLMLDSSNQTKQKPNKSGFKAMFDFSSFFEDNSKVYGDLSGSEVKKLVSHLDLASTNLCRLFSLSPPDSASMSQMMSPGGQSGHSMADQSSFMNTTYSISAPVTPDCRYSRDGPTLTPMGRYQLMNGLRKFDLVYQGDPDLQPIRSFENTTLVRLLYRISAFINKLFHAEIQRLYARSDVVGRMSQIYFAAPLSPSKAPSSPMSKEAARQLQIPRLSLRFLASYQTLLYLGLVYVFLRLAWGVGPVGYVCFLFVCTFMYGLLRALTTTPEIVVR